ncbi:MAG: IS630 family transposase [Candidatus Dormibacteraeota bacterium]|nr:IS630 family transposase [Candidatus Dormibacteraeota bacterium]
MTTAQRQELIRLVRAGRTAQRLVLRARIVLMAAAGHSNAAIAATVASCADTVRKWRHRWAASPGTASLGDAKRSGRPPRFTAVQVAQVKALACTPPAETAVPISRWSCPELARQAVTGGICASLSAPTVRRWLSEDAIKPWQHQSWIFVRDPDFAGKAGRVLDLYAGTWGGAVLGADEYVISADEKTSIQARCRCHPSLPPGRSRIMRVNHDYDRRGALAYLAAYDVHRGQVFGRCEDTTGIASFTALVDQVMTREPYASARRVFWVVDNGSSHRGQAAVDRLAERFPNAVMVHTPVHASWLNQVEIFFSIIQRKVISPNDFTDLAMLEERLARFEVRYNSTAGPFDWKFTTADLAELLTRLDQHRPTQASPAQAA